MNDQALPLIRRHVIASMMCHAIAACAGMHLFGVLRQENPFVAVAVSATVIVCALTAVILLGGRPRSAHERSHVSVDGASRPKYGYLPLLSNRIASLPGLLFSVTTVALVGWWAYGRLLERTNWSFMHIVVLYVGMLCAAIVIACSINLLNARIQGKLQ